MNKTILTLCMLTAVLRLLAAETDSLKIDFSYAPKWWQTAICLPDDPQKTIVGKEGQLFYHFPGPPWIINRSGAFSYYKEDYGFDTKMELGTLNGCDWIHQYMHSAKVPIVYTIKKQNNITIRECALSSSSAVTNEINARIDYIRYEFENTGLTSQSFTPLFNIGSTYPINYKNQTHSTTVGDDFTINFSCAFDRVNKKDYSRTNHRGTYNGKLVDFIFPEIKLAPGEKETLLVWVTPKSAPINELNISRFNTIKNDLINYWENIDLPFEAIQVPDTGIQNMIDASIRNIFQAKEIKNGYHAFQVGPTVYRTLWVVDGAFFLESMASLGVQETRSGIDYMLSFQEKNGRFRVMMENEYWKETGIIIWAACRHAMLSGDKDWLRSVWPKIVKGMNFLTELRKGDRTDSLSDGLLPNGFPDGGIGGHHPEYTNVYWSLIGMKKAIDAALWLNAPQISKWREEYHDFYSSFQQAAKEDMVEDKYGNKCLPIIRKGYDKENLAPQKAQWAFLQAIHPGKLFDNNDPIVKGNMAMLSQVEKEGGIVGTGWVDSSIWTYFSGFYANALLWNGQTKKAQQILYDFANHSSPLYAWMEEQTFQDDTSFHGHGDMPHNWASVEFIRVLRHFLVIKRNKELHLLEGLPKHWAEPGMETSINKIVTELGIISFNLKIDDDRRFAKLDIVIDNTSHPTASNLVIHLKGLKGTEEVLTVKANQNFKRSIQINLNN